MEGYCNGTEIKLACKSLDFAGGHGRLHFERHLEPFLYKYDTENRSILCTQLAALACSTNTVHLSELNTNERILFEHKLI